MLWWHTSILIFKNLRLSTIDWLVKSRRLEETNIPEWMKKEILFPDPENPLKGSPTQQL